MGYKMKGFSGFKQNSPIKQITLSDFGIATSWDDIDWGRTARAGLNLVNPAKKAQWLYKGLKGGITLAGELMDSGSGGVVNTGYSTNPYELDKTGGTDKLSPHYYQPQIYQMDFKTELDKNQEIIDDMKRTTSGGDDDGGDDKPNWKKTLQGIGVVGGAFAALKAAEYALKKEEANISSRQDSKDYQEENKRSMPPVKTDTTGQTPIKD
jgi:hypothetical protein